MSKIYVVISWDTEQELARFECLTEAKHKARKLGYTQPANYNVDFFTSWPPVARVDRVEVAADGTETNSGCCYNPRFPMR